MHAVVPQPTGCSANTLSNSVVGDQAEGYRACVAVIPAAWEQIPLLVLAGP